MMRSCLLALVMTSVVSTTTMAHSGPPFPIVTNEARGPYAISIWTDPDATNDGVAAGQFWVTIEPSDKSRTTPPGTHATVTVRPLDNTPPAGRRAPESSLSAIAAPVRGELTNQFATVVLDHEGPFAVYVAVDGPLGQSSIESRVDATYDLRPAPYMLVLYLVPFVVVGSLWTRLLIRRRAAARAPSGRVQP